jgi:hypothetical protein
LVYFVRFWNWNILFLLSPFGILLSYSHYFKAIWYTYFVVICYIFPLLVFCIKKNLATLLVGWNSWTCPSTTYTYLNWFKLNEGHFLQDRWNCTTHITMPDDHKKPKSCFKPCM